MGIKMSLNTDKQKLDGEIDKALHLWSPLSGVSNLESCIENIGPLPEIPDFALATVKDRGKTLVRVHQCFVPIT